MKRRLLKEERWILIGIPVLFIIGSLWHSIYEFTGNKFLVGLFAAVNESIWEHTKMVLIPIIAWFLIYYLVFSKKHKINKDKWLTSLLVSLITSIISIPMLYYFYTSAFGIESIVCDILILFLAIAFGQSLALHIYRYSKGINHNLVSVILILIVGGYIFLTLSPPKIPMFRDGITKKYGIEYKK